MEREGGGVRTSSVYGVRCAAGAGDELPMPCSSPRFVRHTSSENTLVSNCSDGSNRNLNSIMRNESESARNSGAGVIRGWNIEGGLEGRIWSRGSRCRELERRMEWPQQGSLRSAFAAHRTASSETAVARVIHSCRLFLIRGECRCGSHRQHHDDEHGHLENHAVARHLGSVRRLHDGVGDTMVAAHKRDTQQRRNEANQPALRAGQSGRPRRNGPSSSAPARLLCCCCSDPCVEMCSHSSRKNPHMVRRRISPAASIGWRN